MRSGIVEWEFFEIERFCIAWRYMAGFAEGCMHYEVM